MEMQGFTNQISLYSIRLPASLVATSLLIISLPLLTLDYHMLIQPAQP